MRRGVYQFGGLYVSRELKHTIMPIEPISIPAENIEKTLTTKFFPGIFQPLGCLPSQLAHVVRSKRIGRFCIAAGDWTRHVLPIRDHPTWRYVAEAIAYGRDGDEKHIVSVWSTGKSAWDYGKASLGRVRRTSEFERVATRDWKLDDARRYVERLTALARTMVNANSIPDPEKLTDQSGRRDSEIGIAIDRHGRVMHFRTGHHRIMLAKQLNISPLKVSVGMVHSRWLEEAAELSKKSIAAAIRAQDSAKLLTLRTIIRDYLEGAR